VLTSLGKLNAAKYNPRQITERQIEGLAASIEEFGLVEPLVWNKRTGNLVGGHQRLRILRAKGIPEAHVVVVDLDDERERALNLALNNPHIAGDWTPDKLADLLDGFDELTAGLWQRLRFDRLASEFSVPELEDIKLGASGTSDDGQDAGRGEDQAIFTVFCRVDDGGRMGQALRKICLDYEDSAVRGGR